MKLIIICLCCLLAYAWSPAQNCGSMNLTHIVDIPSTTFEMTMTMQQDNTGKPYLYVASKEGGLKIYDIANLQTPILMRTIPSTELENLDVMNLTQSGSYLYLALGNHFTNPEHSGFAIVDVSSPANASVTDTWQNPDDSSGSGIIKVEGNYAYLGAMRHGLIIFEISNKSDIKFVSQFIPDINYPTPNPNPDLYNARGMEVRAGIVYLCYDAGGIRIINTLDKQNPRETGRFSNPVLNGKPRAYNNLVLDDTLLYVAVDYCGIEVLNIIDTADIKLIGWWNPINCQTGNWFASPVHANEIVHNKTCRQLFTSTGKSDMYVIDISDPTHPDSCNIYGGIDNQIGTWGVSTYEDQIYLSYIFAIIPFQSNWTGVKILTYTPCTAGVDDDARKITALYPQPASSTLTIEVGSVGESSVYITAVSMYGVSFSLPFSVSENGVEVDISQLADGAYTIRVIAGDKLITEKFIKTAKR